MDAEIAVRLLALHDACRVIGARVTPDGFVKARTAARLLDKSESRLATMRSDGTGPASQKRGQVYYELRELARWQVEGA